MATYTIYFTGSASASVTVEADSLEEAEELAWQEVPGGVCGQCSGYGQHWSLDVDIIEVNSDGYTIDGDWVDPSA